MSGILFALDSIWTTLIFGIGSVIGHNLNRFLLSQSLSYPVSHSSLPTSLSHLLETPFWSCQPLPKQFPRAPVTFRTNIKRLRLYLALLCNTDSHTYGSWPPDRTV